MTKNYQKLIKSLHQKKNRIAEQLFLVEGSKSVAELLTSNFVIKALFYTESFYEQYHTQINTFAGYHSLVTTDLLAQCGTLQSNDGALAVVEMPQNLSEFTPQDYTLALADIRDPGNLGAIIRIADWYGISQILCSETTVDWYNPKVIIASMGSFLRVKPYYYHLPNILQIQPPETHIYGMFLGGENIHTTKFTPKSIIVIGNEANGIDAETAKYITHKITIPKFGEAESLNAAMATAILCDNLRR
jgi:TrmH family RNA methyltransferase